MIARSEPARYAKALFFEQFNDADVFVEDTALGSPKIYSELLSRALNPAIAVSQVFPLGPKQAVLKRCASDQGARPRRAVYIVDGDYDILGGHPLPPLKRLFRLRRYCVENYLVDPVAVVDVACDESLTLCSLSAAQQFDHQGWLSRASAPLSRVVLALAVAHVKQCDLPTVKIDLAAIQGKHRDHIDPSKAAAFEAAYEAAIDAKYGAGTFRSELAKLSPATALDFALRHGSGKSLLLPLVRERMKRKLGVEVELPKLKVKLARRCDVSELAAVSSALS